MDKIQEISNKIFNKGDNVKIDFYFIWDLFMSQYGYISKEEMLKMDSDDVDKLIEKINERYKRLNKHGK